MTPAQRRRRRLAPLLIVLGLVTGGLAIVLLPQTAVVGAVLFATGLCILGWPGEDF